MQVINPQINRTGIDKVTVRRMRIGHPTARDGRLVTLELQEWAPAPTKAKASTAPTEQFGAPQIEANVAKPRPVQATAKNQ